VFIRAPLHLHHSLTDISGLMHDLQPLAGYCLSMGSPLRVRRTAFLLLLLALFLLLLLLLLLVLLLQWQMLWLVARGMQQVRLSFSTNLWDKPLARAAPTQPRSCGCSLARARAPLLCHLLLPCLYSSSHRCPLLLFLLLKGTCRKRTCYKG
jgi:hypothetical protein